MFNHPPIPSPLPGTIVMVRKEKNMWSNENESINFDFSISPALLWVQDGSTATHKRILEFIPFPKRQSLGSCVKLNDTIRNNNIYRPTEEYSSMKRYHRIKPINSTAFILDILNN